jgi:hypothetical protein
MVIEYLDNEVDMEIMRRTDGRGQKFLAHVDNGIARNYSSSFFFVFLGGLPGFFSG